MHRTAIVLAGGAGSRLGRDKAREPFFGSTLVDRVVAAAEDAGLAVIVVTGDPPPPIRSRAARVILDPPERRRVGPLAGFATGLEAARGASSITLLLATDHPFLVPALLAHLCDRLEARSDVEAVVPRVGGHDHPLLAAYRSALAPRVAASLDRGERSLRGLLREIRTEFPGDDSLRAFDPDLRSFLDIDDENDLVRARELARGIDPTARASE